jgi:hypothetical protein
MQPEAGLALTFSLLSETTNATSQPRIVTVCERVDYRIRN